MTGSGKAEAIGWAAVSACTISFVIGLQLSGRRHQHQIPVMVSCLGLYTGGYSAENIQAIAKESVYEKDIKIVF